MARHNRNTSTSTSTNTETSAPAEVQIEVQEDTVSTTTTEAPEVAEVEATEAPVEVSTEEPKKEKKEKKEPAAPIDLTEFKRVVEEVIPERDLETGELADQYISAVREEFNKLNGTKAKNAAKSYLNDSMRATMELLDGPKARSYMILSDKAVVTVAGPKAEKTPTDPTDAFVQRVVALKLALQIAREAVTEGVKPNWQELANAAFEDASQKVPAYLEWVRKTDEERGDEQAPSNSRIIALALRIAEAKSPKGVSRAARTSTFTGERRHIEPHIASAFAGVEDGAFLTVAQIKAHQSEEYGSDSPSAGAISIRLFPKDGKACTLKGVTPGTNEKGNKGAYKAASN